MENTMETAKKGGFRKALRFLVSALLSLLLMASVYVGAVLLQTPLDERGNSFVVQEEREPVTRMQSASSGDPRELARLYGTPLPMLEGHSAAGTGEKRKSPAVRLHRNRPGRAGLQQVLFRRRQRCLYLPDDRPKRLVARL